MQTFERSTIREWVQTLQLEEEDPVDCSMGDDETSPQGWKQSTLGNDCNILHKGWIQDESMTDVTEPERRKALTGMESYNLQERWIQDESKNDKTEPEGWKSLAGMDDDNLPVGWTMPEKLISTSLWLLPDMGIRPGAGVALTNFPSI